AMEGGCKTFGFIKAMDDKQFKNVCHSMREDGALVEAGENDNLIVQRLAQDKDTLGIFGYSFLLQNSSQIQAATISGVEPTPDTIAAEEYPVARSLFFCIENGHVGVVPGIKECAEELTTVGAWGDNAYLVGVGLIPSPRNTRIDVAKNVR